MHIIMCNGHRGLQQTEVLCLCRLITFTPCCLFQFQTKMLFQLLSFPPNGLVYPPQDKKYFLLLLIPNPHFSHLEYNFPQKFYRENVKCSFVY